jgi:hypothetical protein
MTLVGTGCGLLFWIGMTTGRAAVDLPRATVRDATLALACGVGCATFVGTDCQYTGNFLRPVVGERASFSGLHDCLVAGFSTALGFFVAQLLLVTTLVPDGCSWCDPPDLLYGGGGTGRGRGSGSGGGGGGGGERGYGSMSGGGGRAISATAEGGYTAVAGDVRKNIP